MRILIVDFAYQNINPTVMLWQLAWRQAGEAVFFGPGHVSETEWCRGLSSFLQRQGHFDVIVCAELVASSLSEELPRDVLLKAVDYTYECPFHVPLAMEGCRRNFEELLEADAIKILSMLEFDTYNMYESYQKRLENSGLYIVGWGSEFIRPKATLPNVVRESFGARVNDRWFEFVVKNKHRIISSPAMVAETEFCWTPLSVRHERWAVQGARYYARQEVRRALSRGGRLWVGSKLVKFISIINRINPCILRWPTVRTLFNHFWQQGFRKSKYAFTCGSALQFPIRKYFEIPASGAVLAAQPCNGFQELGFCDGKNAIATEPSTVLGVDRKLRENPDWAQAIASAGRELAWEKHRVGARAKQYAKAVESIARKCFRGSRWLNGDFVVDEDARTKTDKI